MTALNKDGRPSFWSGGSFGPKIEHISPEDMGKYVQTSLFLAFARSTLANAEMALQRPDRTEHRGYDRDWASKMRALVEKAEADHNPAYDGDFEEGLSYHTTVGWRASYAEQASWFLNNTFPALQNLDDDPENVRIIFFFDN